MTSIITISDTHINSAVALCPPVINLDDGGTYHASRLQSELWRFWLDFWEWAATFPAPRVLLHLGDLGELDTKRRTVQLVSANKATILRTVLETLAPALDVCERAYFIRGTMAHIGKSAWLEETIASDLDITARCNDSCASFWHLRRTSDGVRIDAAHHASLGANAGMGANRFAERICAAYNAMDEPLPHLALRAHNHRKGDSGDNWPVRAIYLPAWSAITEFGYRSGYENSLADIGGLAIVCAGGTYEIHKRPYKLATDKRVWRLAL